VRWIKDWVKTPQPGSGQCPAVLVSSHQLEEVENCADRVLILKDGSVLADYALQAGGQSLAGTYYRLMEGEGAP